MAKKKLVHRPCPHCGGTGKIDGPPMIGDLIYHYRSEKGMTREQLADAAHIDPKRIEAYERRLGDAQPSLSTLSLIAKALKVDLKDLIPDGYVPPKRRRPGPHTSMRDFERARREGDH